MSIADGFALWAGKALFEMAMFGALLALLGVAVGVLLAYNRFIDWLHRRKAR